MHVEDFILGSLELENVWVRDYVISLFGEKYTVELNVEANNVEKISSAQRDAFRKFDKNSTKKGAVGNIF